jgi:kynurenine formamidase
MTEWRVQFDAEVTFSNGGSLSAREFRLDIPGGAIEDDALGELFVRHMGLLMVGSIKITNKMLVEEPHKGSRGVEIAPAQAKVVDLSHVVEHGMVTHAGLPGPEIGDWLSRADSREKYATGTEFQIGRITMVSNTGTYVDSPGHRFSDGADLARTPLAKLVDLPGVVVRLGADPVITRELLLPFEVKGKAVLIETGWDRHWGTDEYISGRHPFVLKHAAEWLVEQEAALVGIDSMNIDDTSDGERPAHTALLAAGIPIVEHMTGLKGLPAQGFRFHAAPPAVDGMSTFPVRAYAII